MSYRWMIAVPISLLSVAMVVVAQPAPGPGPQSSATPGEMQQIESLLQARKEYLKALQKTLSYYKQTADAEKLRWAEDELKEFHMMLHYPYIKELDPPGPQLQGTMAIPDANELVHRAWKYKEESAWGEKATANQRRAEILLQELLTKYPQSDKIAVAAFMLGDLYEGKAFNMPRRAAWYYERCYQWNPKTTHDVLIRAARIYDRKLNERGTAIDFYKKVIDSQVDPAQKLEATKRLRELSATR